MGFEHILYEVGAGVGLVTLNRPDKLNALSGTMLAELLQALEKRYGTGEIARLREKGIMGP